MSQDEYQRLSDLVHYNLQLKLSEKEQDHTHRRVCFSYCNLYARDCQTNFNLDLSNLVPVCLGQPFGLTVF